MYKDVLRSIDGVGVFPSISLILFLAFFLVMLIYLYRKGKGHWEDVARIPLEPDETMTTVTKGEGHEDS